MRLNRQNAMDKEVDDRHIEEKGIESLRVPQFASLPREAHLHPPTPSIPPARASRPISAAADPDPPFSLI